MRQRPLQQSKGRIDFGIPTRDLVMRAGLHGGAEAEQNKEQLELRALRKDASMAVHAAAFNVARGLEDLQAAHRSAVAIRCATAIGRAIGSAWVISHMVARYSGRPAKRRAILNVLSEPPWDGRITCTPFAKKEVIQYASKNAHGSRHAPSR